MLNLKCMKYRINFCDVHPILFIFDLTLASIFYDLTNHLVNAVYIFFFFSDSNQIYKVLQRLSTFRNLDCKFIRNVPTLLLTMQFMCFESPIQQVVSKITCAWRRRGDNLTFQNNHMHMHDFEIRQLASIQHSGG